MAEDILTFRAKVVYENIDRTTDQMLRLGESHRQARQAAQAMDSRLAALNKVLQESGVLAQQANSVYGTYGEVMLNATKNLISNKDALTAEAAEMAKSNKERLLLAENTQSTIEQQKAAQAIQQRGAEARLAEKAATEQVNRTIETSIEQHWKEIQAREQNREAIDAATRKEAEETQARRAAQLAQAESIALTVSETKHSEEFLTAAQAINERERARSLAAIEASQAQAKLAAERRLAAEQAEELANAEAIVGEKTAFVAHGLQYYLDMMKSTIGTREQEIAQAHENAERNRALVAVINQLTEGEEKLRESVKEQLAPGQALLMHLQALKEIGVSNAQIYAMQGREIESLSARYMDLMKVGTPYPLLLKEMIDAGAELNQKTREQQEAMKGTAPEVAGLSDKIKLMSEGNKTAAQTETELVNALVTAKVPYKELTALLEEYRAAQQSGDTAKLQSLQVQANELVARQRQAESLREETVVREKLKEEFLKSVRPMDEVVAKLDALAKSGIPVEQITRKYMDTILSTSEAQKKFGEELPKGAKAWVDSAKHMKEATEHGNIFGKMLGTIGHEAIRLFAVLAGGAAIGAIIKHWVEAAIEFEHEWARVSLYIRGTREEVEALRDELLKLPGELGKTKDLAEGLRTAFSLGYSQESAVPFLKEAARLAKVTGSSISSSVEAINIALKAYGKSAEDVEEISNSLFNMVLKSGNASLDTMSHTMARVLPLASTLGIKFDDVATTLAAMRRAGMPAHTTFFTLNSLLMRLADNSGELQRKLRALGVDANETAIRTKGWIPVLSSIAEKLQGNAQLARDLGFEGRQLSGVLALVKGDMSKLGEKTADVETAFGNLEHTVAGQWTKTLNDMERGILRSVEGLEGLKIIIKGVGVVVIWLAEHLGALTLGLGAFFIAWKGSALIVAASKALAEFNAVLAGAGGLIPLLSTALPLFAAFAAGFAVFAVISKYRDEMKRVKEETARFWQVSESDVRRNVQNTERELEHLGFTIKQQAGESLDDYTRRLSELGHAVDKFKMSAKELGTMLREDMAAAGMLFEIVQKKGVKGKGGKEEFSIESARLERGLSDPARRALGLPELGQGPADAVREIMRSYQEFLTSADAKFPTNQAKVLAKIVSVFKEAGQDIGANFERQLAQMAMSENKYVRGIMNPVWKSYVETVRNSNGEVSQGVISGMRKMWDSVKGQIHEDAIPIFDSFFKNAVDATGHFTKQARKLIDEYLSSFDSEKQRYALKKLEENFTHLLEAGETLNEQDYTAIINLMESIKPEEKALGFKLWGKTMEEEFKRTGTIAEHFRTILSMALAPSRESQEAALAALDIWLKSWRTGAKTITEDIFPNLWTALVQAAETGNAALVDKTVSMWSEIFKQYESGGRSLEPVFDYIVEMFANANPKIQALAKEGAQAWFDVLEAQFRDAPDKLMPFLLKLYGADTPAAKQAAIEYLQRVREYEEIVYGGISEATIRAFTTLEQSSFHAGAKAGRTAAIQLVENFLDVTGRLKEGKLEELWAKLFDPDAEKRRAAFSVLQREVENATDQFGQIPRALTQKLMEGLVVGTSELEDYSSSRILEVVEKSIANFGRLPEGIIAHYETILSSSNTYWFKRYFPQWQQLVEMMRNEYGDLPVEVERVNQKLISKMERMSRRLTDEIAETFASLPRAFADKAAEILVEGGNFKDAMVSVFKDMSKSILRTIIEELLSPMKELLRQFAVSVAQIIRQQLSGVMSGLSSVLGKVFGGIAQPTGGGGGLAQQVLSFAGGLIPKAASQQQAVQYSTPQYQGTFSTGNILAGAQAFSAVPGVGKLGNLLTGAFKPVGATGTATTGGFQIGNLFKGTQFQGVPSVGYEAATAATAGAKGGWGGIASSAPNWVTGLAGLGAGIAGGYGISKLSRPGSVEGAISSIAGGMLASFGMTALLNPAMLPLFMAGPAGWIVLAAIAAIGPLVKAFKGKNAYEAGAMEVGRDFGGISMGSKDFQGWLQQQGISEPAAYPVRKDIEASPKFIVEVLAPLAKAQGKMEEFRSSLEQVKTAWGTFDFRKAFEFGELTGDWTELDEAFKAAFKDSQALIKNIPDWQDKLLIGGEAAKRTAQDFMQLYTAWKESGEMSEDFVAFMEKNAASLDAAAKSSELFAEKLREARDEMEKFKRVQEITLKFAPEIEGFSGLLDALNNLDPIVKSAYETFAETGEITAELDAQIRRLGGDIQKFADLSGWIKLNTYWQALVEHFRETGEILPDLRRMFEQFGVSLEALDAASELPALKASFEAVNGFMESLASFLPDLSPLQEVLEGIWSKDTWGRLEEMGFDPSKFVRMTDLIKFEKNWEQAVSDFYKGAAGGGKQIPEELVKAARSGSERAQKWVDEYLKPSKLQKGGELAQAIYKFGGAEGQRALDLYFNKGINVITPELLSKVKAKMDEEFREERTNLVKYLADHQQKTLNKITTLNNNVENGIAAVNFVISTEFEKAKLAVVKELQNILVKIQELINIEAGMTRVRQTNTSNVTAGASATSSIVNTVNTTNTTSTTVTQPSGIVIGTRTRDVIINTPNVVIGPGGTETGDRGRVPPGGMDIGFERGGPVERTGMAMVHMGEFVLSKEMLRSLDRYERGGLVRETGPAIVHQGEYVLTKEKTQELERCLPAYQSGGFIRNTGLAKLHEGEYVISNLIRQLIGRIVEGGAASELPKPQPDKSQHFDAPIIIPVPHGTIQSETTSHQNVASTSDTEVHFHFEGATINGMADFEKMVSDAFTKVWRRGGFSYLRH